MRSRGFTLIEVLVSLLILAVMSAAAWKGMDAITRARDIADGKLKQTLRLQSVMTQWEDDLAAVVALDPEPFGADLLLARGIQIGGFALEPGHGISRFRLPLVSSEAYAGDKGQFYRFGRGMQPATTEGGCATAQYSMPRCAITPFS